MEFLLSTESNYVLTYLVLLPSVILLIIITFILPSVTKKSSLHSHDYYWTECDAAASLIQRAYQKHLDDVDTQQQVAALVIQAAYASHVSKSLCSDDFKLYQRISSAIKIQRVYKTHVQKSKALRLVHSISTLKLAWSRKHKLMLQFKALCRTIASRWMENAIDRGTDKVIQHRVEQAASEKAIDTLLVQMQLVSNSCMHFGTPFSHLSAAANSGRRERSAASVIQFAYLAFKSSQSDDDNTDFFKSMQKGCAVAMRTSGMLAWSCEKKLNEIHNQYVAFKTEGVKRHKIERKNNCSSIAAKKSLSAATALLWKNRIDLPSAITSESKKIFSPMA